MIEQLNDVERARMEEAMGRMERIASFYYSRSPAFLHEDISLAATWGLVLAARSYRDGESDSWSHWSAKRVKGTILTALIARTRKGRQVEILESDVETSDTAPLVESEDHFEWMLSHINHMRTRRILVLVMRDNHNIADAARIIGISPQRAHIEYHRALEILRSVVERPHRRRPA